MSPKGAIQLEPRAQALGIKPALPGALKGRLNPWSRDRRTERADGRRVVRSEASVVPPFQGSTAFQSNTQAFSLGSS